MTIEKLLSLAVKQPNGCVFVGNPAPHQRYHSVRVGKARMGAHRFVWESLRGPIPDGLEVCHTCDDKRCININHLFLGTQSDNLLDAARKGRFPRCEKHDDEFSKPEIPRRLRYKLRHKRDGLCAWCGAPAFGFSLCQRHLNENRESVRRRYRENRIGRQIRMLPLDPEKESEKKAK